jgi:Ca-activated chloride channel family protein
MRMRILPAAGMAALAGFAMSAMSIVGAQQQVPMFSSGTDIVPLYVTVTDRDDRLVANLRQEDFEIFDDEVPQEIVVFRNDVQPISVVVMLDTSASMTAKLNLLMAGAEQFLIRLLPGDQGRVGAFNDKIELSPEFTGDRDRLVAELGELDFGNPTRLYDAIDSSLDALKGIEGRRVVLVFTDGDDTGSDADDDDVLDRAIAEEVMIYAIGLRAEFFNGARMVTSRPDRGLRKFAQETGGGYFELRREDELGSTFTRVAKELHSQYVIGFTPAALDGELHALDVQLRRPGMTARARRSYIADAESLSSP